MMTRSNFPKQVTPAMARTRNPAKAKPKKAPMPPRKERKC
jgi:hypothetical protein